MKVSYALASIMLLSRSCIPPRPTCAFHVCLRTTSLLDSLVCIRQLYPPRTTNTFVYTRYIDESISEIDCGPYLAERLISSRLPKQVQNAQSFPESTQNLPVIFPEVDP